jgi:glucose-6-phosphate isomerase/transaldolase/glucose-6-phosphate isomerase
MANPPELGQAFVAVETEITALLDNWREQDIIARLWAHDHTLWRPEPTEISNRLGWLTVADSLLAEADALATFGREIAGQFNDVVLLGMGGSSLATEVLRATLGRQPGFPRLHVLDSTVPGWIRRVAANLEPATALFIVASKSGTTAEVSALFRYFYDFVSAADKDPGRHFVAITDPNTPLQELAETLRFRRLFQNDPNIGGRYSALSHFGMVPAALAGLDVHRLLRAGQVMARSCGPEAPIATNDGAWLAAALVALASRGRDKLTFVASPVLASFGLWAEQLIAESLGKDGKGLTPIALEPAAPASAYRDDRVFVYLRLDGADNRATDDFARELAGAGQPFIRFELSNKYQVGAEFFRWELATALVGVALGVHPFDQPNVQDAKSRTKQALQEAIGRGATPPLPSTGTLPALLAQARAGDYLAIMAYLDGSDEVDQALQRLRRYILINHRLANTMGYGPRFLHSTGQLHKGGPNNGLFLQLVAEYGDDVSVPGEAFSFGQLASSQAAGDFSALKNNGRRAVRLNLGRSPAPAIMGLLGE